MTQKSNPYQILLDSIKQPFQATAPPQTARSLPIQDTKLQPESISVVRFLVYDPDPEFVKLDPENAVLIDKLLVYESSQPTPAPLALSLRYVSLIARKCIEHNQLRKHVIGPTAKELTPNLLRIEVSRA
jgi:hypothetical protein